MPVRDRRSTRKRCGPGERWRHIRCGEGAARTWAWRSVMCAGFALRRDAGRRPALHKEKVRPRGAVAASGAGRGAARTWAWRSVMRAGFALPRDAGRRPALHKEKARPRGAVAASGAGRGAARTLAWLSVMRAGFALPRDAGQRPALQAVPALVRDWRWEFRGPAGHDAGQRPALHGAPTKKGAGPKARPQGSGLRSPRR